MEVNDIFEELASNNSRIFKTDLLIANKDNEDLKESIRLALDSMTQFYIRKIPTYTNDSTNPSSLKFALGALSELSNRHSTGNAAIRYLRDLLSLLSASDAKVIERIISKDLKCGVSVSTANAVWPKLVSEYPCMLCAGYEQKLIDKMTYPAFAQLKSDGMRVNAIVKSSNVEYRSRNGKLLDLQGYLDDDFIKMSQGKDVVFDGELLVKRDGKILDRQTGNGILSKMGKGTATEEEASLVRMTVWDAIPYDSFFDEKWDVPYDQRLEFLTNAINGSSNKIELVPNTIVNNLQEAQEVFQKYLSEGLEGIILKSMSGVWENKRSKSNIKFKSELECELKIVGTMEGSGKYKGLLGSIICQSSDDLLKVNVGSGLTDELRVSLNASNLIGKIITVKYNARIKNKQGEESLFLPIFIEIREDKDKADSIKDIK